VAWLRLPCLSILWPDSQGNKIDSRRSNSNILNAVSTTISTNNTSKGIIGLVRQPLKRRANSEPIIVVSSLIARRTSNVIQMIPKINLLACLHKMYTQLGYFVNAIRYRLIRVSPECRWISRLAYELNSDMLATYKAGKVADGTEKSVFSNHECTKDFLPLRSLLHLFRNQEFKNLMFGYYMTPKLYYPKNRSFAYAM